MKKSLATLYVMVAGLAAGLASAAVAAIKSVAQPMAGTLEQYMARNGLLLTAITLTNYQADGSNHGPFYARHLDDAGAPAAYVGNPGFRPKHVTVINLTDRIQWDWYQGMAVGSCIKTVAAGTRTLDVANELSVVTAEGSQPSITLAAAVTLQNKQYQIIAR